MRFTSYLLLLTFSFHCYSSNIEEENKNGFTTSKKNNEVLAINLKETGESKIHIDLQGEIKIKRKERAVNYIREILMLIVILISSCTLLFNVKTWKDNKKRSLEDEFWIRDILMPNLIDAFDSYMKEVKKLPKKEFQSYYARRVAPKRTHLLSSVDNIKHVHPNLHKDLCREIIKLDDVFYEENNLKESVIYLKEINLIWSIMCKTIYKFQIKNNNVK